MISKTAEYALRAVVALAGRPELPLLAPQLTELTGVRPAYLQKVLQMLAKSDLVDSQRGPGGGFKLARRPDAITALDVVNAVEPIRRIESCPLSIGSHSTQLCPLHRRIDEAIATFQDSLAHTTVAELVPKTDGAAPLCGQAGTRKP